MIFKTMFLGNQNPFIKVFGLRRIQKDFKTSYQYFFMNIQKNDFIEIEFTGRIKGGGIFDSNIKKDLEEIHKGHNHPIETKPLIFVLGQGMFLKGVEDFLINKPSKSAEYEIELSPEQAFGKRDTKLIQIIPMKIFREQNLKPSQGAAFNFDGRMGRIITISGGRIIVDFNNPLAGKEVAYKIKILRKVEDLREKIKSFIEFLFRKELDFEVKDKKIVIKTESGMKQFVELFKDKFKEIFDLDLEVESTIDVDKPSPKNP